MLQSIILGLVQGLGEFLPISSSGHLIIVPWIMGWEDHGLTFDVALHFGTLLSLIIFFRRDILTLIQYTIELIARPGEISKKYQADHNSRLVVQIFLASIPGAVIGLLLEKKVETVFRFAPQVAVALAIMGFILWYVDRVGRKTETIKSLKLKHVLMIGFAQGLAVVPGISRSGSTISMALALGQTREDAARFSFLLALPITLGACLLKLKDIHESDLTLNFFSGIFVSFLSGLLAIGFLLKFVRTRSFGVFAIYRFFVSAVVLYLYLR